MNDVKPSSKLVASLKLFEKQSMLEQQERLLLNLQKQQLAAQNSSMAEESPDLHQELLIGLRYEVLLCQESIRLISKQIEAIRAKVKDKKGEEAEAAHSEEVHLSETSSNIVPSIGNVAKHGLLVMESFAEAIEREKTGPSESETIKPRRLAGFATLGRNRKSRYDENLAELFVDTEKSSSPTSSELKLDSPEINLSESDGQMSSPRIRRRKSIADKLRLSRRVSKTESDLTTDDSECDATASPSRLQKKASIFHPRDKEKYECEKRKSISNVPLEASPRTRRSKSIVKRFSVAMGKTPSLEELSAACQTSSSSP